MVGLADTVVNEARDRVRAAVVNSGTTWPDQRVTINLAPSTLPKSGSHYDLAIGLAVFVAKQLVPVDAVRDVAFIGELALDGRLRAVRGVLPATIAAADAGFVRVFVPECHVEEAELVEGVQVVGVRSLRQAVALLTDQPEPDDPPVPPLSGPDAGDVWGGGGRAGRLDVADVAGQEDSRAALVVAAAGGHHLLMTGPPGIGKTMLAQRLPGLLPPLTRAQSLEVSAVHSLAGVLGDVPLVERPPFVDPHHTASAVAVVGGGQRGIRPGALSLAHRGVLFLDEASNGKRTSFLKEVTDEDEDEAAWRERATGAGNASGGLSGVHPDGAGHAGRGHAADLPVSAAVEVSQGQGGRDRASAP